MNQEPRNQNDYSARQTDAARRVLVDLGQVLAGYYDCLVVVGGWVPDLLLPNAGEPHIGSIDVDLALDAQKLNDGRYAELLTALLDTRRYRLGEKPFQFLTDVELDDGEKGIQVAVEFLASKDAKLKKNKPKRLEGFRVLQAEGCNAAFHAPVLVSLAGQMIRGSKNVVKFRVASLPDFLVMKAHALGGRDKPKDAYDIWYCLGNFPDGLDKLTAAWKDRNQEKDVKRAVEILREKFASVESFGPGQVVEFLDLQDLEAREMHARRAFELVQKFLSLL